MIHNGYLTRSVMNDGKVPSFAAYGPNAVSPLPDRGATLARP